MSGGRIDPSIIKAGDTVTVEGTTTAHLDYTVTGVVWEPSHSPGSLWVGPVALDASSLTLTSHRPAPEPEPEVARIVVRGTTCLAIRGKGIWWTGDGGFASDDEAKDVRPLAVIDPAAVDVDHLVDIGSDTDDPRTNTLAILAGLGIELAR